jgi:transglutaminase-like putative cysteine protease
MLEAQPPIYALPLAFFTAKSGDTRKVSRESLDRLLALSKQFLPEKIVWSQVRRCVYFSYQQFQYVYPSPAHDLEQHLLVMPRHVYGGQRLRDFKLCAEPIPLHSHSSLDAYGNTKHRLHVAHISHWTSFEVMFCVENSLGVLPLEPNPKPFKQPTALTTPDQRILETAQRLRRQSDNPLEFARRASDWVSNTMQYKHHVTNVTTTAAQALEAGAGLCQDYSHIFLALCRAIGLPARYVSGHMVGEGASHAWCEVLLPNATHALDPTNAQTPNLGYTVVGVGRDYNDVTPTTGRFTSDSAGVLHFEKHAGILELELHSGEVLY